jgi:hypothetical protein
MTTKNFFIYQAILNGGFGLGLLLVPQAIMGMYLTQTDDLSPSLDFVLRAYGTALIGFGFLSFMFRNTSPSYARYITFQCTALVGTLATLVHLRAILQGVENNQAWGGVVMTALVTVWAAWLLSKEDKAVLTK